MPKRYDTETIERGLIALAINAGNTHAAQRQLARDHVAVPVGTLRSWKEQTYRERYHELCATHRETVEAAWIAHYTEAGVEAAQGAREAITKAREQLRAGEVRDASSAAYRLALAAGILQDKARILLDLPTSITEHRDASEILNALESRYPRPVEGTASEVASDAPLELVRGAA